MVLQMYAHAKLFKLYIINMSFVSILLSEAVDFKKKIYIYIHIPITPQIYIEERFSSVQSLSRVRLFVTP